ncbi:MAG: 2OG-Fe dioxygenase family protein [Acidobacteria bacterium]|nr:2OG-Fe dioxygenase family protein [Acidobacteriota bacterium]
MWGEWDHLQPDRYLKSGASFRLRRLGCFELTPATGGLRLLSHAAYYQPRDVNPYAGGIHRRFAALRDSTATNRFLHELIRFDFSQFPVEGWEAVNTWTIDVHLFRIIGNPDEAGEPTPEGVHHDGDEFNAVHLVQRENAVGGVSGVYDNDQRPLERLTLREPMDSLFIWDPHVMHGVSPIRPKVPGKPAIRDVLIIGYNPDRSAAI